MSGTPEFMDFNEARQAARDLASARRRAEEDYRAQVEKAAGSEREYRKKYAVVFISEEGTVALKEQAARLATADLCFDRDLQAGMVKASHERLQGLEGERAMLGRLMDWSLREGTGPQPQWSDRKAA